MDLSQLCFLLKSSRSRDYVSAIFQHLEILLAVMSSIVSDLEAFCHLEMLSIQNFDGVIGKKILSTNNLIIWDHKKLGS